jgi:hypothetical protein
MQLKILSLILGVLPLLWPLPSPAQSPDDPRFREAFQKRYAALKNIAPDLAVMELRDRVELVASRGSQVGAASNQIRVRGFESELLRGLQAAQCKGGAPAAVRPAPEVIEKVNAAASAQRLRVQPEDIAELSAIAQRIVDSQSRQRWCALKSLDDIR